MKLCGTKMKTSTAYHPQTDGLTERTNQTLETYLRSYCSYQQDDWVDYLALAEFTFNNSTNSSTQVTPFFAGTAQHPKFDPMITDRSTNPSASELADRLDQIHAELRAELSHSNDYMAKYYDKKHMPAPVFAIGDYVWLLRRNIKTTRPSLKLDYRRLGPFQVLDRRGVSAYLLKLPSTLSRLHPVFNVSLLEPYHDPSVIPGRDIPNHPRVELAPSDYAKDIESILDSRKVGRRYDYFISWKGLPLSERSWVPFAELPNSLNEVLEQFHRRNPARPHPPRFSFTHSIPSIPSISTPTTEPPPPPHYNPPRTPSPTPGPWLRDYQPPNQTTLRSGRVARPPASKDYASSILKGG